MTEAAGQGRWYGKDDSGIIIGQRICDEYIRHCAGKDRLVSTEKRKSARRKRIVAHLADGHADAQRWDLEYWQQQGPQARLEALVAIREDIEKVKGRRRP